MNRVEACTILQVSTNAGFDEIRLRFRSLANRLHPDRFLTPGERAVATRKFQDISEAFGFLRDFQSPDVASPAEQPNGAPPHQSGRGTFDEQRQTNVSSWELLEPLKRRFPWLDFVLDILLLPALLPLAVIVIPLMWLGHLFERTPRLANLMQTLGAHFLPGVLAILIGVEGLAGRDWWAPAGGLWFILSGATSITMEVIAQTIGIWQLIHPQGTLLAMKDVDAS